MDGGTIPLGPARTSYSNATPSGSFSWSQFSAASGICEHLESVGVFDLLARIDVEVIGPSSISVPPMGIFAVGIEHPIDVTVQRLPTPIRAIIVGPLRATNISASIAACHSGRSDSFFGKLVM